jgi:hypothetical protein
MITGRNTRGNMLTFVTLTMGMIIAVAIGGLTLKTFLLQRSHGQCEADAMAVRLAAEINDGDRVAQINELEESSRELIYVSSKQLKQCMEEDYSFLTPLCQQLLAEDRAGHALLEHERQNLLRLIPSNIQKTAREYNTAASQNLAFAIPWLRINCPKIQRIDVGYIENVESNVKNLDALEELADFDRRQGYIDRPSNLYMANINACLPEDGSNLSFNISSLPAYVEKTCAPARNVNPDVFVRTDTIFTDGQPALPSIKQIPNAIQIFYSMNTAVVLQDKLESDVSLISTGVTNGGMAGSD